MGEKVKKHATLRRGDAVYIPFDAHGAAETSAGRVRVYVTEEKAAKVGFFGDSLVRYEPVRYEYWIEVSAKSPTVTSIHNCSGCRSPRYSTRLPNYCQECGARMIGVKRDLGDVWELK